jgi:hypothetical protein
VKWTKERAVVAVVAVVFFLKAKPQRCIKKQDDACPGVVMDARRLQSCRS